MFKRDFWCLLLLSILLGACNQTVRTPDVEPETVPMPSDIAPQTSRAEVLERVSLEGLTVGGALTSQGERLGTVGEWGKLSVQQAGPDDWDRVDLEKTYTNPVVVVQPLSYNGGDPATARVRNVRGGSFEVQIDEWDYLDGGHTAENVSYLVFEAGRHRLGSLSVEAGKTSADDGWKTVTFGSSFSQIPVILSQTQSVNEKDAVVTRQSSATKTSFRVRLQEEEANTGGHADETVGYIALEPGTGNASGVDYKVAKTGFDVYSTWYRLDLGDFNEPPAFLASIQSYKAPDTATLRYRNLAANQVEVFAEEEQSKDEERGRAKESVGYAAFASASSTPKGVQTARPLGSRPGSPYGYYEYLPAGYDQNTNDYPVLIFLHGVGEQGNGTSDLNKVVENGPPALIAQNRWAGLSGDAFVVLSPQSPSSWNIGQLQDFIDYAKEAYRVDDSRVYLTGLSMGAIGIWSYLKTFPEDVAAAIPIAGNSSLPSSSLCRAKDVPIWAFHGENDGRVNPRIEGQRAGSINLVEYLNNSCNPPTRAKVTLYKNVGHNSWTDTYDLSGRSSAVDSQYDPFNQNIYSWLLQQRR